MIQLQVRDRDSEAWRAVNDFQAVNPKQIEIVEHSRQAARLVNVATGKVVARSLPARGVPVDKVPEGIIREFVMTFRKPEEVHQATPDPNRKQAIGCIVKRPSHKAFASDGYR